MSDWCRDVNSRETRKTKCQKVRRGDLNGRFLSRNLKTEKRARSERTENVEAASKEEPASRIFYSGAIVPKRGWTREQGLRPPKALTQRWRQTDTARRSLRGWKILLLGIRDRNFSALSWEREWLKKWKIRRLTAMKRSRGNIETEKSIDREQPTLL